MRLNDKTLENLEVFQNLVLRNTVIMDDYYDDIGTLLLPVVISLCTSLPL